MVERKNFKYDSDNKCIFDKVNNKIIIFQNKENELLKILIDNENKILDCEFLSECLGINNVGLRALIYRIRNKTNHLFALKSCYGRGYMLKW